jgi:HSP20 family protein
MTLRSLVPSLGRKRVPVKYSRGNPFSMFHMNMDRMFEDFFSGFDLEPFESNYRSFRPDIEVTENDKEIKVSAELPGMEKKDIDVSLTNGILTISGDKKDEQEEKGKDYFMKERTYGSFKRLIPLHAEIEADKIDAHFKKGVLTIKIPKSGKVKEKKRTVKVE